MFGVKATTVEGSGRIILNFPYSSLLAEKVKTIFGYRCHHTEKQRSYSNFHGIITKILKVFGGKGTHSCHSLQLKSSFAQTTNPVITKRPESGEEIPKRSRKGQSISTLSRCNFKGQMYRFTTTGTALQPSYWKTEIFCSICGLVLRHKLNMQ